MFVNSITANLILCVCLHAQKCGNSNAESVFVLGKNECANKQCSLYCEQTVYFFFGWLVPKQPPVLREIALFTQRGIFCSEIYLLNENALLVQQENALCFNKNVEQTKSFLILESHN